MTLLIVQETTVDGKVQTRINWMPIAFIGLTIVAIAVFATLLISRQGGETVRVSPMEQKIGEKLASGQALTSQEQAAFEKMQAEGIALAEKLLNQGKVAPVAPVAPAAPAVMTKDEGWTKTFQLASGPVEVRYVRTNSAKGKVAVWMDIDNDGELRRNIQNISDKPIEGRWTFVKTDMSGEKWEPTVLTRQLKPGQIATDWVGVARDAKLIETYFEVTS